jgi:hypothetical protein
MNTVTTALARIFEAIAYGARAVSRSSYRISERLETGDPELEFWIAYVVAYCIVMWLTRPR